MTPRMTANHSLVITISGSRPADRGGPEEEGFLFFSLRGAGTCIGGLSWLSALAERHLDLMTDQHLHAASGFFVRGFRGPPGVSIQLERG